MVQATEIEIQLCPNNSNNQNHKTRLLTRALTLGGRLSQCAIEKLGSSLWKKLGAKNFFVWFFDHFET